MPCPYPRAGVAKIVRGSDVTWRTDATQSRPYPIQPRQLGWHAVPTLPNNRPTLPQGRAQPRPTTRYPMSARQLGQHVVLSLPRGKGGCPYRLTILSYN